MRLGWTALIALCAAAASEAPACDPALTVESLLNATVFELAELPFSALGFAGSVSQVRCASLRVGGFDSAKLSPGQPSVLLRAIGVDISCTGRYAFAQSFLGWPFGSGDVAIKSAGSGVGMLLTVVTDGEGGFASDVRLDECAPSVAVTSLDFSGGLSAAMLDLFIGVLRPAVASMVGPQLCAMAADELARLEAPAVFASVARALAPLLEPPPPPKAATPDDNAYSWADVALGRAALAFNTALTDPAAINLQLAMRSLVNALGARADGRLGLGSAAELDLPVPGLNGSLVRVRRASIGGLDSISHLQLARPAGVRPADGVVFDADAAEAANRTGLVLELAFDRVSVAAELLVELGGALALCGTSALELRADSIRISAVAQLPLLPSALDSVDADELIAAPAEALPRALSCLLASVDADALALVRVQASLEALHLDLTGLSPGGLWPQLVGGLERLAGGVAVEHFGDTLLRAAEGAIAGPLSAMLQAEIARLLQAATYEESCVPNGTRLDVAPWPDAPSGALPWANSSLARIASGTLNALVARGGSGGEGEGESAPDDASPPLVDPNKLVRALTNGASSRPLRLMPDKLPPVRANLTLGELTTLDFSLSTLAVAGLDSILSLEVVPASPAHERGRAGWGGEASAFIVTVEFERLAVSADLSLSARASELLATIFAADSDTWLLIDDGRISLALGQIKASALVRVPLRERHLANLSVGCALAALEHADVRLLEVHAHFASVDGVELEMRRRPLWRSIASVINFGMAGLVRASAPSLSGLLDAAVKGPVLELLDSSLRAAAADFVANSSCISLEAQEEMQEEPAPSLLANDGGGFVSIAEAVDTVEGYLGDNLPLLAAEVARMLTGGEGTIAGGALSRPLVAELALPACLGVLNVSVDAYRVEGLASFSRVGLASVPAQNQSVELGMALGALNASVDLRFSVGPPAPVSDGGGDNRTRCAQGEDTSGRSFELTLRLAAEVDNPSVDATVLVEIVDGSTDAGGNGWTLGGLLRMSPAPCSPPSPASDGVQKAANDTGAAPTPSSNASSSPVHVRLASLRLGGVVTSARALRVLPAEGDGQLPSSPDARPVRAVDALDGVLRSVVDEFGAQLVPAAGDVLLGLEQGSGLFDGALGALFGSAEEVSCGPPAFVRADGLIEWSRYPPLDFVHYIAHDLIGVGGVNAGVRALTRSLSGTAGAVDFGGELLRRGARLGDSLGDVAVEIGDAQLRNGDTLIALELLGHSPAAPALNASAAAASNGQRRLSGVDDRPSILNNAISIGGEGERALSVSAHTRIQFDGRAAAFALALRIALELTRLSLAFALDVRVDAERLAAVRVESLLDGSGWMCLGAAVDEHGLRLSNMSASIGLIRPVASELWAVGSASEAGAPLSLEPIERALAKLGADLTPLLNEAMQYALPAVALPLLNGALDTAVLDWRVRCATGKPAGQPGAPEDAELERDRSTERATVIALIVVSAALGLCAVAYAWWWARWRVRTRPERARMAAGTASPVAPLPIAAVSPVGSERAASITPDAHGSAAAATAGSISPAKVQLSFEPPSQLEPGHMNARCGALRAAFATSLAADVRPAVAAAVTVGIWLVIALFAWINVQVSAELVLVVESPIGFALQPAPLYQVSIGNILNDMGKKGLTPVAVIIVLLSGVWPFLKLFGLLTCWLAPSTVLPPAHREAVLHTLHAHSKWSLVDVAILQIAMVAFNLQLSIPAEWLGGLSLLTVSTYVLPAAGMHGLLYGTLASICLSHIVLAYHVSIRDESRTHASPPAADHGEHHATPVCVGPREERGAGEERGEVQTGGARSEVPRGESAAKAARSRGCCAGTWEPLFRSAATDTRLERRKLALALVGLPCSIGMATWGSLVNSFKLEITGLAGLLIGASGEVGSRSFSLLDLALALPTAMMPASAPEASMLMAEFLLLHLLLPIALPCAIALLWAVPLPLAAQRQCYLAVQLVNAVCGIDIFMLALAVGLYELEHLGQFLLKGRCAEVNELLALYALELLDGDPRCFSVSAGLERGYWVLLTAAIVSFLASRLVLRRCELALERRSACARS